MKKILLFASVVMLLVSSCKKDEPNENEKFLGVYIEQGISKAFIGNTMLVEQSGSDTLFVTAGGSETSIVMKWAKSPTTIVEGTVVGDELEIEPQNLVWDEGTGGVEFTITGTGLLENGVINYDAIMIATDTSNFKLMVDVSATKL